MSFADTWMDLETVKESEVSQKEKVHRLRNRVTCVSVLAGYLPGFHWERDKLNLFKSQLPYRKNGNNWRVVILDVKSINIHNHLTSLMF